MRRLFSSSSPAHGRHTLPILRLPTTLFPHQCFSLSLEPPEHERRYNVLTPQQLQEAWSEHGGRLAALAWGSSVGVELQLLQLDDTEACDAPLPTPPLVHHAVGGQRCSCSTWSYAYSASPYLTMPHYASLCLTIPHYTLL